MIKPFYSIDVETGERRVLDAPPDDAQFIIVVRLTVPLLLPDNKIGQCAGCGQAVQFRPEVPEGFPTVCYACVPDFVVGLSFPQ
jgi:hypothetical protein